MNGVVESWWPSETEYVRCIKEPNTYGCAQSLEATPGNVYKVISGGCICQIRGKDDLFCQISGTVVAALPFFGDFRECFEPISAEEYERG